MASYHQHFTDTRLKRKRILKSNQKKQKKNFNIVSKLQGASENAQVWKTQIKAFFVYEVG